MRKHVDVSAVAGLHGARDFQQGRIGRRLDRRASGIEGEDRRDADDDAAADLQDVEADSGRLPSQLGIEVGHVGADFRRAQRPDLGRAHLGGARFLPADDIAEQVRRADAERRERGRHHHRRWRRGLAAGNGGNARAKDQRLKSTNDVIRQAPLLDCR